jgi:hypothetical protein
VRRAALTAALVAAAATCAMPVGAVAARQAHGLRDARYCEILELKGALPHITAVVWNTIKLNSCPAAQWNAFDAGALARELGDPLVVLNGPRHFLMDSATAVTGPVRSFDGLRMRRLATIPIRTAADLAQTPYTDRTIERTNTFHWNKGRTVFELLAPGGDLYLMQSYAQIRDPSLTLDKLGALGRRLQLPAGWRFRSRRLHHALTLTARGRATILQDELLDTYQLARSTRSGPRRRRAVHVTGTTRLVPSATPGAIQDRGRLTGRPFGRGTSGVTGKLQDGRFVGTFSLLYPRGSITGTLSLPFTLNGTIADLRGPAHITGGTGAFRGITARGLQVHDRFDLSAGTGRLGITGSATY